MLPTTVFITANGLSMEKYIVIMTIMRFEQSFQNIID